MGGGGGSLVSCLPVFCRLSVRTSEHSLKLETGTKCQVDRSGFLFATTKYGFVVEKICTWWPWKPVFTQAAAYSAGKLTTKSRGKPVWKCNGF